MASSIQAEEEHTAEHMDDELGYFYLEDCDVYLSSSFSIDGSEWMDVQVPTAVSPLQWELSTDPKACDKIRDCSHCKLVVRRFKQEPSLCLVGDGPRFDGTIDDAQPDPTLCSCKTRQRSDAALLMGLALTCQDLGHISIKSIRIAFASVSSQPEILSQGCKTNDEIQSESPRNDPCRRTAALIITFSTQEVTPHLPRNRKSSKSQKPKRRLISASLKPLPPPTQLLLNLLRSDWDALDIILRNPQKPLTQYRYKSGRPCSLFPPRISLDEVYRRIGKFRRLSKSNTCLESM